MASDFSVGSVDASNIPADIDRRYIELLWNWLQKLRWFNEFAHGSLNDMAWLEVVWHFHNMWYLPRCFVRKEIWKETFRFEICSWKCCITTGKHFGMCSTF